MIDDVIISMTTALDIIYRTTQLKTRNPSLSHNLQRHTGTGGSYYQITYTHHVS